MIDKLSDLIYYNQINLLTSSSEIYLSAQGAVWLRDWLASNFDLSSSGDVVSFTALQDGVGWSKVATKESGMTIKPGKFITRLDKHLKSFHVHLSDDDKVFIGNELDRHWIGGKEIYYDFASSVDWSIGQFGENPNTNCWVGSRLDRFNRKMIEGYACAVRLFRKLDDGEKLPRSAKKWYDGQFTGIGRAWLILNEPQPLAGMLFNTYGPLQTPQLAAALTKVMILDSYYELYPIYIGGDLLINHNIHGEPAAYVIGFPKPPLPTEYDNPAWCKQLFYCANCGRQVDKDSLYYTPDTDERYCEDCMDDNYKRDYINGNWLAEDDALYLEYDDIIWVHRNSRGIGFCTGCGKLNVNSYSLSRSVYGYEGNFCSECLDQQSSEYNEQLNRPISLFMDSEEQLITPDLIVELTQLQQYQQPSLQWINGELNFGQS